MFELLCDPLLNAYASSLEMMLNPAALMADCQATPGHLKLVCFNGGSNPIPFTLNSCEDYVSAIKHDMLFDIPGEQLRIEFVGKVAKKDLSEWLRDCRQVRMCRKCTIVVSVNEYYNTFGEVTGIIY
jgi:hypothetical protein